MENKREEIFSAYSSDLTKYGLAEGIILFNIRFWINKNKANNRHFYDGKYWTYNSIPAFAKLFPFLSEPQIKRALKRLEEKKAISSDIRDIFAEAKSAGFDVKIMRAVIKLRKMNAADRDEQEFLLDTYKKALDI